MTVLGRGSENDFNREDKLGDLFFLFFIYQVINKSLKESKKMIKTPKWTESVQDDFRVIDYDIFYNTIQRMQYE